MIRELPRSSFVASSSVTGGALIGCVFGWRGGLMIGVVFLVVDVWAFVASKNKITYQIEAEQNKDNTKNIPRPRMSGNNKITEVRQEEKP